ncbi:MAG: 23S rRNA (pseudouridine(1915)-N(3))-methyltransferase RlmH [Hyphomicrobium sp.]
MQVNIFAIGRLRDKKEIAIVSRYQDMFSRLGRSRGLGPLGIKELPESKDKNQINRKNDEAARLIKASSFHKFIFVLDVRGEFLSSHAFAKKLQGLADEGNKTCAFIIGGPDGHGDNIFKIKNLQLSLSSFTLSHGLARVVLVEQLYRAATILTGHPYHRE